MSLLTLLVIALLVGGVVATLLPKVPGGVFLSLAGVYLHWWASGFSEPSTVILAVLTLLGVLVSLSNLVGPVIAGKVGGTPAVTTTIGTLVGVALFFVWGVTGLVLGTLATVFVLEYLRRGDVVGSLVAAVTVVLATFAEKVVRLAATLVILGVMVAVIVL